MTTPTTKEREMTTATSPMIRQMEKDTTISRNADGTGQVHVFAAPVAESDKRFFMDYEWVEWFEDTHPEWRLDEDGLVDLYETSNYQYLWMARIVPTYR
jgi:hypothetical protein